MENFAGNNPRHLPSAGIELVAEGFCPKVPKIWSTSLLSYQEFGGANHLREMAPLPGPKESNDNYLIILKP